MRRPSRAEHRTVTVDKAAKLVGVERARVSRWIRLGLVETVWVARQRLVLLESLFHQAPPAFVARVLDPVTPVKIDRRRLHTPHGFNPVVKARVYAWTPASVKARQGIWHKADWERRKHLLPPPPTEEAT